MGSNLFVSAGESPPPDAASEPTELFLRPGTPEGTEDAGSFSADSEKPAEPPEPQDQPLEIPGLPEPSEPPAEPQPSPPNTSATPSAPDSATVSLSLTLRYQQLIVESLLKQDGLLVLGRGLGLYAITANLLHALSASRPRHSASGKSALLFLLGARDDDNARIAELLTELSWIDGFYETQGNQGNQGSQGNQEGTNISDHNSSLESRFSPFITISGEGSTIDKRRRLYSSGGIISLSPRMLVVDFLSGVVDPQAVTGFVLLHADRISELSAECFALTLYRASNQWGFIKAVSEDPAAFSRGFAALRKKLRALHVDRLFLWPRFHIEVSAALSGSSRKSRSSSASPRSDSVVEISVPLSDSMRAVQSALIACLDLCLADLRRFNPTIPTAEDWNSESALLPRFLPKLRAELDPYWHRLSPASRALVRDVELLVALFGVLVSADAVRFYETLRAGMADNAAGLSWRMADAGDVLVAAARGRVFSVPSGTAPRSLVLEPQPKWAVVADILEEIQTERRHGVRNDGPVLIVCQTRDAAAQLRAVVTAGGAERYLRSQFQRYLARQRSLRQARPRFGGAAAGGGNGSGATIGADRSDDSATPQTPPAPFRNKRRRMRGGATTAGPRRELDELSLFPDLEQPTEDVAESETDISASASAPAPAPASITGASADLSAYKPADSSALIVVHVLGPDTRETLLEELMPSHVILYEPDTQFVRRVELLRANLPDHDVRTFFLYYGDSVEEQRYLGEVRAEKDAFTRLIRERANLAMEYRDGSSEPALALTGAVSTRLAGGLAALQRGVSGVPPRVLVDMRELRSPLPFLLYQAGFTVVPLVLLVGDYVLSPRICVERKSVPDLIQSLKSGRLYTQCEAMFRHYELPVLLVEFAEGKSFSLEPVAAAGRPGGGTSGAGGAGGVGGVGGAGSGGTPSRAEDLQAKLVLLLLSFPKLKIVWSASPRQTTEIFAELRATEEPPDPATAANYGLQSAPLPADAALHNTAALEMLQAMPGVNSVNVGLLARRFHSLKELANASEAEMAEVIGKEPAGKLYRFLNFKV